MAVAEAVMLQFQEEIDWLVDHVKGLKSVEAASRFRYLPAAGFLPVGHNEFSVSVLFYPEAVCAPDRARGRSRVLAGVGPSVVVRRSDRRE